MEFELGRGVRARRAARACRATGAALVLLLLTAACSGARRTNGAEPTPAAPPPLSLAGQRVLVLPLQRVLDAEAVPLRARIDAELRVALAEREGAATWIGADELRRALRRSPGYAPDPGALPDDPLLHHSEARAVEPLAGALRRYAALTDTRLVVLPRSAALVSVAGDPAGRALRLEAAVVDARSGAVLWRGEAAGTASAALEARTVATAAAELARRLVSGGPSSGALQ